MCGRDNHAAIAQVNVHQFGEALLRWRIKRGSRLVK
jgi:hypothetical protein